MDHKDFQNSLCEQAKGTVRQKFSTIGNDDPALNEMDLSGSVRQVNPLPTGPFGQRTFQRTNQVIGAKKETQDHYMQILDHIRSLEKMINQSPFNDPQIVDQLRSLEEVITMKHLHGNQ